MDFSNLTSILGSSDTKSRLVATEADRQRILTESVFSEYLTDMRKAGDMYLEKPQAEVSYSLFKTFDTTGDRYEHSLVYFDRRGRLAAFGMLTWLYGEERYVHALEDIIWSICDEYTWALPAHLYGKGLTHYEEEDGYTLDLFACETASALAEIIALNGDLLSPIVVRRARLQLRKRVLDRFLEGDYRFEHMENNWSAVCAGAIGIAALYEARSSEQAVAIVSKLDTAMQTYIGSFPSDGTSMEGISYWYYGFSFFTAYAEMVKRVTGGTIDYFADSRVKNIALFQHKAYIDDKNIVCFADCGKGDTSRWWGLTSYLKRIYPEVIFPPRAFLGAFGADRCHRWIIILRDLVWADTDAKTDKLPEGCELLPDAQWLICRGKRISIAAKGGSNGESHNHNDLGSFELFIDGKELLIDYGGGVYSRDYFSSKRYTIFTCASRGHSVPIIEGYEQSPGKEHAAKALRLENDLIELELAAAYDDPNLISYIRRISFDRDRECVEITDSFRFESACNGITERFVSFSKPALSDDSVTIDNTLKIAYDTNLLTPEFSEYIPPVSSGTPRTMHLIDFKASKGHTQYAFKYLLY